MPPVAAFTFAVDRARVDFEDTTPGSIKSRRWQFGDGTIADTVDGFGLAFGSNFGGTIAAAEPSHTYATGGDKTVTLTVSNPAGESDDVSHDVVPIVETRRRGAARLMGRGLGL